MSNITGGSLSFSSGNTNANGGVEEEELLLPPQQLLTSTHHHHHHHQFNSITTTIHPAPPLAKKKRNLPGNPDPKAEVIALSPRSLLATNRFICEICNKGFQRDQNLQLHRRGHNLPWKLKQRNAGAEVKKRVYVCPEPGCVHHNPARALGDLTGIKKHFCRKHGEKKWQCEKCSKKYAVQSDWKAHGKTCGTKEYKCDCGHIFSRRDSFITHRAFCDALAEENNKEAIILNPSPTIMMNSSQPQPNTHSSSNNNINIIISPPPPPPPQISNYHQTLPIDKIIDRFGPLETKINPFTMKTSLPRPIQFSSPNNYNITPTTTTTATTITTTPNPSLFSSSSSSATSSSSSLHLATNNMSPLFDRNGHPASSPTPSASMSATALLQKAAQMGSALSSMRPNVVPAANVAPKQAPPFGSDQQAMFMDQFFHLAGGGLFNGNFPGCPSGFFDDGDNDNSNNAAALLKNFGGEDVMTTVDFLGVNNTNGGTTPTPSSTSAITRISNMVTSFSPPL